MEPASRAYAWSVWPALLLAPLLALGDLTLVFALVWPECAHQGELGLHLVKVLSLAAALAMTAFAGRAWRRLPFAGAAGSHATLSNTPRAESRPHFLALVATLTGAFSSLVIAALWVPLWWLPPCS